MRVCSHASLVIQLNIQSVFNDQRTLICNTKKIKQHKLPLKFKAYYFGSALTGGGKSLTFKMAVRTYSLWAGLCPEKLVKLNKTKTNYLLGKF